jgi:capsular exopolysaccharide synthesis family protein
MKSIIPSALVPDHAASDDGLESQDLSLRQAIRVLRKRYRLILMVTAGCLLLVVLASRIIPPRFATTSTIEIKQSASSALGGGLGEAASALTGQSDLKTDLQTAISTFQDQQIGVEVLQRMQFEDREAAAGSRFWKHSDMPDKAHRMPLREDAATREALLAKFEKKLDVQRIPDSRLLQVTYKDEDPKFAAAVTNAVVDQYIKDELSRRNIMTVQASEWMANQLDDLRKQVEAAQQKLVDFEKKSGFIVVPSMGGGGGGASHGGGASSSSGPQLQSTLLDRLLALNQTLVQAQANRITQEAIYRVVQTEDPNAIAALATTLSPSSSSSSGSSTGGGGQGAMLAGLLALRQDQVSLKQQLAATFDTYGPKNPHSVELRQQIAYLDTEMKAEMGRLLGSAASSLKIAKDTEAGVKREVEDLEHQADGINDSAVRLAVLQQEADSTRLLYEDLYTKLEEARLAQETQSSNVAVISEALPAATPKFPNWPLNIAIGMFGGLTLGVIAASFKESLDDSIVTSTQIEGLTRIPVLGSIPKFEGSLNLPAGKDLPKLSSSAARSVMGEVNSQAGEAFRALRTALLLSQPGAPPRALLVTSPLPAEGKSTTCYNLAVSFAMLGKRVLMIDADMRKPTLHRRVGHFNSGLSTLLTSQTDPADTIVPDPEIENLSLLLAGPTPPNPTELLGSGTFSALIESVSKQYDLVLIDTPPTMLVADPAIISTTVDGVVVVVRAGSSTRLTLMRTLETLRRNRANVMGFVLNFVDTKSSEYYYAHGYYGGKYYGENFYGKDKS